MIYIVNDGDFCHIVKSEQMSSYQYAEVLLEGHSTFTETSLVNRYVNVCKQRFKICVSYMAAYIKNYAQVCVVCVNAHTFYANEKVLLVNMQLCSVSLRARYTTIKGTKYAVGYMVCCFIDDDEVPTLAILKI